MSAVNKVAIASIVDTARSAFNTGVNSSQEQRRTHLLALRRLVTENENALHEALHADLHKNQFETDFSELNVLISEINAALRSLSKWMKTSRVRTGMPAIGAQLQPEPLGAVLIMAPWNYPVQLLLNPLIGVLAAGNTAVLKPAPETAHVAALLGELIPRYFPDGAVTIATGPVEVATELLTHRFDFIVFTGSGKTGKIILEAAAKHLTPVLLELGGKSPTWVDAQADLEDVTQRIAWAKFLNAGQTCVAPDYVMTPAANIAPLKDALEKAIRQSYGDDPQTAKNFGRIVSEKRFDRLVELLGSAPLEHKVSCDKSDRFIQPTVVVLDEWNQILGKGSNQPLMSEEIFGPILPIVPVETPELAIEIINAWDKPLALYTFGTSHKTQRLFEQKTSSGAVAHNVALIQAGLGALPFGGVGASGMGRYHGKFSFDTFSHHKPAVKVSARINPLKVMDVNSPKWLTDAITKFQRKG